MSSDVTATPRRGTSVQTVQTVSLPRQALRGSEDLGPLTPSQSDLYVADRAADDPTTYHVALVYRVEGALDDTELRARFERLLAAHPMLAACVVEGSEGWFFAPAERAPALHVSSVPIDPESPLAARRVRQECRRPMDPARGPLLRVVLLRYPGHRADLVVVAHHLVVDEPSAELMARWLLAGDEAEPAQTFAAWGTATAVTPDRTERAAALRDELAAADLTPALDWAAPTEEEVGGAICGLRLHEALWEQVRKLSAELRITPYSFVVAAAGLVFGRNARAARPVLGATVSRRTPRHAATVGYFNSTVPVPLGLDAQPTVADFLRQAHARSMRAYRDADLPLSTVLPKGAGEGPRLVVVPTAPLPEITAGGARCTPHTDLDLGTAQFPLALYLRQEAEGLHGLLRYQRGRISASAAEQFCRQVETVVAAFVADPDAAPWEVVTVPRPSGAGQGLTTAPVVQDLSIPELFARQVARDAGRVAVTGGRRSLTYAELDAESSALACVLVEAGVEVGDRVGVCLPRGAALIVGLLGVLKAGAVYVPLDAGYPAERLAFVVEDTGVRVVVGDALPPAVQERVRTVEVSAQPQDAGRVLPAVDADALAYVIHTSGSTGRPKGVLVAHRNVMALLAATKAEFQLGTSDVWSFFHSFAFDFSVWEIWGCLLTGGRLVVVDHWAARDPEELHATLAREKVTVLSQTPSAFSQLIRAENFQQANLAVRLLIFGGEPLDSKMLLPWLDHYPETSCRAVNMYGITETTVHCTWHTLTRADALTGTRSVGRPLPGWQLHILDEHAQPVPPGVAGEIYIGGAGVAQGYGNRPELTAQRFLPDHLTHTPGARLYRSGDLGRYTPDGHLEHLGRLDDQVKIRGHRIEPGEIRTTLLEDARVSAAAALVRTPDGPATARVDAYVVVADPEELPDIRRVLVQRLPAYLVPATLTAVPELPLTPNGKLDAVRLPDPVIPSPADASPAPEPGGEDTCPVALTAIWQQVIGVPVGPDDNFFDLGGNSLLAVQLNAALRKSGFPEVRLRDIFRHSTPRRLAVAIESRGGAVENASKLGGKSA
ncbi:amino acid adenylation domain-containing protein [Streptomyces sp. BHT-5-2]|uniref:non-ribosomal peptide synthetase n=1 Tax=Streptomyces sp. BHT-5-2 TaxID=2866715 RepID=UPI0021B0D251|nr:non-ribosomal peptide synthetase [Streptomyces sp. BHT-5-2]